MLVTKSQVKKLYPPRSQWCHKGEHGRLLVIAGSKYYSGSPTLVAMAAARSGVDWVDVFSPKRAADITATHSPDLVTHPQRGDFLNSWHLKNALTLAKRNSAVVIGPGLGRREETEAFVTEFLRENEKPCVIDADAIHFVAEDKRLIRSNYILTPHANEFYLLTGIRPKDSAKDRQKTVHQFAKKLGCTILLKGNVDVISDGKKTAVNKTGHPVMAKAGTGDTLAGIAGALLARGSRPYETACAAAWINGAAGELAARELGESFMSHNILNNIHKVLK